MKYYVIMRETQKVIYFLSLKVYLEMFKKPFLEVNCILINGKNLLGMYE